jgi:hypothetical protein
VGEISEDGRVKSVEGELILKIGGVVKIRCSASATQSQRKVTSLSGVGRMLSFSAERLLIRLLDDEEEEEEEDGQLTWCTFMTIFSVSLCKYLWV